jgi:PAS domain S-box-containing protein
MWPDAHVDASWRTASPPSRKMRPAMFEHELQAAARRLAAIVESSDDAILSKDLEGVLVTWNPAAQRMFGYTPAEAIGQSIRVIIPDDRQAEEDLVLARIRAGQTVSHFETIRQRKDGSRFPVSATVSPVRDPTGRVVGASTILRDISDRRRAERALIDAEAARTDLQRRLLTLVAASGSLLAAATLDEVLPAILTLAGQLVTADGYAVWRVSSPGGEWKIERSHGVSEDFCRSTVAALSTAQDRAILRSEMVVADVLTDARLAHRREAYVREGLRSMLAVPLMLHGEIGGTLVFYCRTPHEFGVVEVQTATALANIASAAMTSAALHDAQRRSRIESEFLSESGKALSASLDYEQTLRNVAALAVPYFADWCSIDVVDESGVLRRLALAHVDPAKVDLAERFIDRFPESADSDYSVARVLATGQPVMMSVLPDELLAARVKDVQHLAAIRELHVTSFMRVPLRAHDQTLGVLTFVSAESGRHYRAPDLRLAQEVAARAGIAVDNARAYAEVRRANGMKDEFLATLSHELRTPLNALLGYARMLKWQMVPPDRHARAFDVIERNGTALARLVDDVLDVSRIVSSKLRLQVQPADLAKVVAQSVETVQAAADAKDVRVRVSVPDALPPLALDADRLQQALWNLLSNAVKFTPPGGDVDVSVVPGDGRVAVVVRDTGIGLAPELLPRMFERFRQADSRYAREHGGLGLGLAIARHLVEMHGGTLTASSDGAGLGATFAIELPCGASPPATPAPVDADPPARAPAPPALIPLDGIRVLAIDDDADELSMMRDVLAAAGAQVVTAQSGREALGLLSRLDVDVVLADIGMPEMDGFDFIGRARAMAGVAARVPAAAITAYARSEDRERALTAGFQMHVSKPIDPAGLLAAVRALVED